MPIPYPPSGGGAPPRTRRLKERDRDKDKEARHSAPSTIASTTTPSSTTGGSSGIKKARTRSTPPHALRPAQPSLYIQPNLTLDQLPPLPGSGTASPVASSSPVLKPCSSVPAASTNPNPNPSTTIGGGATPRFAAAHLYTPIALRPYLDKEDDEDDGSSPGAALDSSVPAAPGSSVPANPSSDLPAASAPSLLAAPDSSVSANPNSSLPAAPDSSAPAPPYSNPADPTPSLPAAPEPRTPQDKGPSQVCSASSKPANFPLTSLTSIPYGTPSPKPAQTAQTALLRSPSPPPQAPSPFWNQPQAGPATFDPGPPFAQNLAYMGNPPPFVAGAPYLTGPGDQYYPSPYGAPSYMSMPQIAGNISDNQQTPPQSNPYYSNYGFNKQMQPPMHFMHSPSTRGRSTTGSRRSFSGEPFPGGVPPMAYPPEQAFQPETHTSHNTEPQNDGVDLLQRIQSAIPDLHLLLDRYKETSGQLGVRESLIRENEAQKVAALKQKESYIEKLVKEADAIASRHAAESSKLRLEINNMEEKQKELQEHLLAEKKTKDDFEAMNRALRAEKEHSEQKFQEERVAMSRDATLWREREQGFATRQESLEAELKRQREESEARWQAQETKMSQEWGQEKATLQASWCQQKREIEDRHAALRRDWEVAMESRQKELDDRRHQHLQEREAWNKEREALIQGWQEERSVLTKASEEQRSALAVRHQKSKDEMWKRWQASEARTNRQIDETQTKLHKELAKVQDGWETDKTKFAKATADLRKRASTLNEENAKLQKLAEAFGDITDLKSREDPFYQDAFHHLHKQIVDLALEHFQEPVAPTPGGTIRSIPPEMGLVFSNPDCSGQLRAAYVEHTVSSIITRRIFKPFLFTVSLRHSSPDQLFQGWSDHMRSKSTRKEALWRQRTLHAAYTVSSAKQSINKIAAFIVDEIVEAIQPFAGPGRREHVVMAVRRIVKTAAETWRYARLEIPMITASMSEEERPAFMKSGSRLQRAPTTKDAMGKERQLLLPLFPIIEREAIHETMRKESTKNDEGCVYFPGRMLYSNDSIVGAGVEQIGGNAATHPTCVLTEVDPTVGTIASSSIPRENILPSTETSFMSLVPPPLSGSRRGTFPETSFSPRSEQMDRENRSSYKVASVPCVETKSSGGSGSYTATASHSSRTSESSSGRSSSTTRPGESPGSGYADSSQPWGSMTMERRAMRKNGGKRRRAPL